jgi:hypothetical protein
MIHSGSIYSTTESRMVIVVGAVGPVELLLAGKSLSPFWSLRWSSHLTPPYSKVLLCNRCLNLPFASLFVFSPGFFVDPTRCPLVFGGIFLKFRENLKDTQLFGIEKSNPYVVRQFFSTMVMEDYRKTGWRRYIPDHEFKLCAIKSNAFGQSLVTSVCTIAGLKSTFRKFEKHDPYEWIGREADPAQWLVDCSELALSILEREKSWNVWIWMMLNFPFEEYLATCSANEWLGRYSFQSIHKQ